jgi:hypothetical protein
MVQTSIDLWAVQRGVTFGFYARNGYFSTVEAQVQVERMAETEVDWVVLVPTVMQDTYSSTVQYRDFEVTPDDSEVRRIIDYIHSKGIKVQLRPMLETQDGDGRLQVTFPPDRERIPGRATSYWQRWFHFMKLRTLHYARMAQEMGCEMYGLDSELDRTVHQNQHWLEVLDAARSVYDGPVTSCHTPVVDFTAELAKSDHWFYQLDMLTISFYLPAAQKPGASVEEMVEFLKPQVEKWGQIARTYGKPFAFGECGCTSSAGGAMHPSSWTGGDLGYDGGEQANYLEAVLRSFWDQPWWCGLYWWKWDEQNKRANFGDDPRGDKGFTVYGKPAQGVMKKWFSRPDRRG